MNILTSIFQFLAYADQGQTDNPQLRHMDWTRRFHQIAIGKLEFDHKSLGPQESYTIFDGTRTTALNTSSQLEIILLSGPESRYRLRVTSGPANFRTPRTVTGINNVTVTVNNNSVATFNFTGATLSSVQVGDIMRIKGSSLYDSGPFVFSALNSGLWKVINVSGTSVQVIRLPNVGFQGANETVTGAGPDVQFYSADGVQIGDTMLISGTFNVVTHNAYKVFDVTPTTIDFVSSNPIPLESGLSYVLNTITFFVSAKHIVYVEADDKVVIRLNDDTSNNVVLEPMSPQFNRLGSFFKTGLVYKITIVNQSLNETHIRFFLAENYVG